MLARSSRCSIQRNQQLHSRITRIQRTYPGQPANWRRSCSTTTTRPPIEQLNQENQRFIEMKLVPTIKDQFGLVFNNPKLLLAAFTDPSYIDPRVSNANLAILGRAYVTLQYTDRAFQPSQLKLWRQDLRAPDYIRTLLDSTNEHGSRVTQQEFELAMSQYHTDRERNSRFVRVLRDFKLADLVRKGDAMQMYAKSTLVTPEKVEAKVLSNCYLALLGAVLIDQGEPAAFKFFTDTLINTANRYRTALETELRLKRKKARLLAQKQQEQTHQLHSVKKKVAVKVK